jgi:hypothetical protein
MKAKTKFIFLSLLAIAVISCKKQTLQPGNTAGPTVFYFNGIVNGSPVSLTAGVNNYYMYSSYTQDVNNVYNFTGSLHPVSCTNCPNSIQFIINDYKTTATGGSEAANIDTSLVAGNYLYLSPTGGISSAYSVTFTPTIGKGTDSNYVYHFGDGATYVGTNGTQTHTYKHPGAYTTTLIAAFKDGTIDSIHSTSQPGAPAWNTTLSITKSDTTHAANSYKDALTSGGTSPYTIKWNFGDGNTKTQAYIPVSADTITHTYPGSGIYEVSATITDVNNYTNTNVFKVIAKDSGFTPHSYISNLAASAPSSIANPKALSNVTIIYTNVAGVAFSSANVAQPNTTNFQVTSVASYQNNELNQTTKMLHIKFTCQLKDGSGNPMTITNGDAIIAVAYK